MGCTVALACYTYHQRGVEPRATKDRLTTSVTTWETLGYTVAKEGTYKQVIYVKLVCKIIRRCTR